MKQIRSIVYGTKEYDDTLALRNKVMRIPLGLDIYQEDFSCEKNSVIIGMFEGEILLGAGVMSHDHTSYKVEYLCVDTDIQSCGIGGSLLEKLESIAREEGAAKIFMDARVSAKDFYLRHGYHEVGTVFCWILHPLNILLWKNVLKSDVDIKHQSGCSNLFLHYSSALLQTRVVIKTQAGNLLRFAVCVLFCKSDKK